MKNNKEPSVAEMMGSNDDMAKKLKEFVDKQRELSFQVDVIEHPGDRTTPTVPRVVHEMYEDLGFISEDIRLGGYGASLDMIKRTLNRLQNLLHIYETCQDLNKDDFVPAFKGVNTVQTNKGTVLALGGKYGLGVNPEFNRFTLIDRNSSGDYVPISQSVYVSGNPKWDEAEIGYKQTELPFYDYENHNYFVRNIYDYLVKHKVPTGH